MWKPRFPVGDKPVSQAVSPLIGPILSPSARVTSRAVKLADRLRIRPILRRACIALLLSILFYTFLRLFGWVFYGRFPNTLLAFLSLWALFYVVVSGLIWSRQKLYSTSPTGTRRLLWRLLVAVPILIVILVVILLSLPFVRWTVAAIQCGHA